ncbi:recombinase family protein [Methanosphaerula palustris]|uniref:Resolvase domain protein n=1 Tax=Methanosphaerula palustris (strain ATCC BAA-1556 / DSM 19958 / E1-9c) TaxID=521011 RepID=B8GF15_METPE|nr:recombinase family protein [Methanosphaerula palustris]ACL17821.1 Resolvase domain protein [Methanosphaerula palustris E1-9c]
MNCSIVGYARTSLASEKIENQTHKLLEAGIPSDLIFTDVGISGAVPPHQRPGFQKMIEAIQTAGITHIYTFELSRISRDLTDTLNVLRDFDNMNVCLRSLSPTESWLQCDPSIRSLITSVMSWCAMRERENLVERTKLGLENAKRQGKTLGRPWVDIDMKKVARLHDEKGIKYTEIAKKMGIKYSTLMKRLNDM